MPNGGMYAPATTCHELYVFLRSFLSQAQAFAHGIRHPASYLSARQIAPVTAQSIGSRADTGLLERLRREERRAPAASS
jgi:hypothetical protein